MERVSSMEEFQLEHPLSHSLIHNPTDANGPLPSALFLVESQHMPSSLYLHRIKSSPSHFSNRRQAISSIFQYSGKFHDPSLTYLAVNYLDRFLSCHEVPQSKPWCLRLISLSCVSLSAKMRKPNSSVSDLQGEGGVIFDTQTIERMDNVILGALKWRMRSITPFSFSSFFLHLFESGDSFSRHSLKARAHDLVFHFQHDIKFLEFKPSVMAASALLVASAELCPLQFPRFFTTVSQCSYVDKVMEAYNAMQERESEEENEGSADTAVNVLDQRFSSSESNRSFTTLDSPPKRRKASGRC
ncbi:PREDICTED: putative cyclin-D6-1 [Tarenaya hassleriana]|uniref:putative cyclin-D6-1 n=1 Tax=Tarenaya hassleriana TaxID=28532 RepID=UPI0008FD6189|nr:PREDICTED: putative cyclin-D6-1 [Tarenaya hassleriana]